MKSSSTIVIRSATADDADVLERLAALDSRLPLTGPAMLAEVDGIARAALDLHDGTVAADPFTPTAELVKLLNVHSSGAGRRTRRSIRPSASVLRGRARAAHA